MSGLNNFYTRAAVIGAKVSIISAENIGTTIIIDTPIKNEKKHAK
jgi:signal transduction histidine kinase